MMYSRVEFWRSTLILFVESDSNSWKFSMWVAYSSSWMLMREQWRHSVCTQSTTVRDDDEVCGSHPTRSQEDVLECYIS